FLVSVTKPFTWLILLVGSAYMLKRMSNGVSGFLWATFLFVVSGLMGWIMLNTPISGGLTLMCLFTGLFGVSSMLFSLNETSFIPHQSKYYDLHLNKNMIKGIFVGGISGAILGFLPGFGPSQGSVIAISLSGGSDGGNDKNVLDDNENSNSDIIGGIGNNDIDIDIGIDNDNWDEEIIGDEKAKKYAKEYYDNYSKNYNVYSSSSDNGYNNELEFGEREDLDLSASDKKKSGDEITNFLTAISGLNTSDTLFSLIAIYLIGNPRSGIAVYMSYLITDLTLYHLLIFICASLIAVSISLMINLKLGDIFSNIMQKVDYKKLSITVIILMIVIFYIFVFVYSAPFWYLTLVLIASTALGLLPHYLGANKSHLMGVLIVPAMIIYMGMI
ncbi:MAG: tripartite tricarboxylate transporter permease, partial [Methanobacteriaceae archaeon]